jgi:hypothetical protein
MNWLVQFCNTNAHLLQDPQAWLAVALGCCVLLVLVANLQSWRLRAARRRLKELAEENVSLTESIYKSETESKSLVDQYRNRATKLECQLKASQETETDAGPTGQLSLKLAMAAIERAFQAAMAQARDANAAIASNLEAAATSAMNNMSRAADQVIKVATEHSQRFMDASHKAVVMLNEAQSCNNSHNNELHRYALEVLQEQQKAALEAVSEVVASAFADREEEIPGAKVIRSNP